MDEIFHKTAGYLDVVKISKEMPHRYGKNGELLIAYEDSEFGAMRKDSVASQEGMKERRSTHIEDS